MYKSDKYLIHQNTKAAAIKAVASNQQPPLDASCPSLEVAYQ
jgi:hypothetical protein